MTSANLERMHWYARQVANNPGVVILVVLSLTSVAIIISLLHEDLPSFKDPLLGFEPRGTDVAQKVTAWRHLREATAWNGPLTFYPNSITASVINVSIRAALKTKTGQWVNTVNDSDADSSYDLAVPWMELDADEQDFQGSPVVAEEDTGRIVYERTSGETRQDVALTVGSSKFFANNPRREYAHVILKSVSGENLFTVKGLLSVCDMDERKLRNSTYFPELCEQTTDNMCSKSWSIPNYVALLQNKSSCYDVNETDVKAVYDLLLFCSTFYHGLKLSHDCATEPAMCRDVPRQCFDYNAVYSILHFLADVNFLSPESNEKYPKLSYTAVFLPVAQSSEALNYYRDLEQMTLSDGITEVTGMQLGLKYRLFDECLIHDTLYVGLAGSLIFILLWMYSSSFFVTLMTILAVVFSLGTAYFMYTVVYQIPFFPFMNLLTIVIIIGIGADDACIYCKIWVCAKAEKNNGTLVKLVRDTLHHACLSMFVTSVTTAVAFFGSIISNITAVRCFSIFAGTAVLANFIFTVSWLPASVILAEKWCSSTCCLCIPPLGLYLPQFQRIWGCASFFNSLWRLQYSFNDASRVFFEKILPCVIIKPRYLWVLIFSALATAGAFVVFYYPRLRLPDSREFQIFSANHPFEMYDLFLKEQFWFEKAKEREVFHKLAIRVVWGVLPVDNGNYLNPYDRGRIVFDPDFDVSDPDSQKWLLNFCIQMRNQSFYQPTHGPLIYNCFIETFKKWMERRCVDGISDADRTPCCESSKFPFTKPVFDFCVREAVSMLQTTGYSLGPMDDGPRFSKLTGEISAVVVEYDSIYSYSNSYSELLEFKTTVEEWVNDMMKTAPKGLKHGWFTSDLEFFDLQNSLSEGTLVAIGVAVAISFAALLVTTLNLLISIYAILTITCVIVVTVGSLVLLGWKLNVLESTTVSVAIGLAVDLTLHYGVAYKLSDQEDRESSVIFALTRVGSPVAMAAFTTFMAGALMFPSVVLAYLQIGKFLVILMTVSWVYSTFFFLSLLSIMGPENGLLQLNYPSIHCCDTSTVPVEKTPYALSESTLSSSSASYPNQVPVSESHELEPLTNMKGARIDAMKYSKKKHRSNRPRSGSCSSSLSRTKDATFPVQVSRTPRKISLPTVSVTLHSDRSPKHVADGTSSSTLVCGEEEREISSAATILGTQNNEEEEEGTSEALISKEIDI